jgi:hypothetical protein
MDSTGLGTATQHSTACCAVHGATQHSGACTGAGHGATQQLQTHTTGRNRNAAGPLCPTVRRARLRFPLRHTGQHRSLAPDIPIEAELWPQLEQLRHHLHRLPRSCCGAQLSVYRTHRSTQRSGPGHPAPAAHSSPFTGHTGQHRGLAPDLLKPKPAPAAHSSPFTLRLQGTNLRGCRDAYVSGACVPVGAQLSVYPAPTGH